MRGGRGVKGRGRPRRRVGGGEGGQGSPPPPLSLPSQTFQRLCEGQSNSFVSTSIASSLLIFLCQAQENMLEPYA